MRERGKTSGYYFSKGGDDVLSTEMGEVWLRSAARVRNAFT